MSSTENVNLVKTLCSVVVEPSSTAQVLISGVRVVSDDGCSRNYVIVVDNEGLVCDVVVSVL